MRKPHRLNFEERVYYAVRHLEHATNLLPEGSPKFQAMRALTLMAQDPKVLLSVLAGAMYHSGQIDKAEMFQELYASYRAKEIADEGMA